MNDLIDEIAWEVSTERCLKRLRSKNDDLCKSPSSFKNCSSALSRRTAARSVKKWLILMSKIFNNKGSIRHFLTIRLRQNKKTSKFLSKSFTSRNMVIEKLMKKVTPIVTTKLGVEEPDMNFSSKISSTQSRCMAKVVKFETSCVWNPRYFFQY